MTRLSLLFLVGLFTHVGLAETLAMALMRDGAIATIQLHVVDEQGRPIEDVEAHLGFWKPASALFASNRDSGTTDEEGNVQLSARCFTDGDYILRKDGYYPTQRHIRTPTPYHETIEEGFFSYRWRDPYVKTEVLRDIRNPCPMKAYSRVILKSPPKGETWGLDLELMEWLPPNGNGKHLDMLVSLELEPRQNGQHKWEEVIAVNLSFPNPMDGVQLCDKIEESDFYSTYQVDLTRPFETQLRLVGSEDRYHFLPYKQYLVFRVRSVVSESGEIVSAHYGKIYPTTNITNEEFSFRTVYFNPVPNDTNLEFDTKRNLAPDETLEQHQRRRVYLP